MKPLTTDQNAIKEILDWQPVENFIELFPNIPEKTIKWQLTNRYQNGLYPHVQKLGKKLFINISGYSEWLNNRNNN